VGSAGVGGGYENTRKKTVRTNHATLNKTCPNVGRNGMLRSQGAKKVGKEGSELVRELGENRNAKGGENLGNSGEKD